MKINWEQKKLVEDIKTILEFQDLNLESLFYIIDQEGKLKNN